MSSRLTMSGSRATSTAYAMQVVYKIVSLDGADWRGWSIRVTDGTGRSILSVLFPQGTVSSIWQTDGGSARSRRKVRLPPALWRKSDGGTGEKMGTSSLTG